MRYIILLLIGVAIGAKLGSIGKKKVVHCRNCYEKYTCPIYNQCMDDDDYCSLGKEA